MLPYVMLTEIIEVKNMSSTFGNGQNEWLKIQQNYWQSWADLARNGSNLSSSMGTTSQSPDWTQGLEQWWKAVSPPTSDPVTDMYQQIIDMGKNFTRLAEQGYQLGQAKSDNIVFDEWLKKIEGGFSDWSSYLMSGSKHEMPDWLGSNKQALEAWDNFANNMGSGFDFSSFDMSGFEQGKEQLSKFLNTPGLGQDREKQQQLQSLVQRALEYQEADLTYKLAFAGMGSRSAAALRKKLMSMNENNENITSVREFYDIWVDVNEQVYGEFVMTDEYQVIYADLVNSLMALRKEMNALNEQMYKAMNIPTRSEVNSIHQYVQQQRRENRRMQAEINALSKKLAEMSVTETEIKDAPKSISAKGDKATTNNNLLLIKGVGPRMVEKLNALGFQTLEQIAQLSEAELKTLDKDLNAKGNVLKTQWAKQAAQIIAND